MTTRAKRRKSFYAKKEQQKEWKDSGKSEKDTTMLSQYPVPIRTKQQAQFALNKTHKNITSSCRKTPVN